jgi:hypothetical protein
MNKEQFIFWLKGFAKAVNEEGPTPKQWETIVSELDQIKDCPDYGSSIGVITSGNTTWTNLPKGANVSYTSNQLELDL